MSRLPFRMFALTVLAGLWSSCSLREPEDPAASPESSPAPSLGGWEDVFHAVRNPGPPPRVSIPGPPVRMGSRVLFRMTAPEGVKAVYLAGDFNGWGQNQNGGVTNSRFRMQPLDGNRFWLSLELLRERAAYQYVLAWPDGRYEWVADPAVKERDREGHSVIELPRRSVSTGPGGKVSRARRVMESSGTEVPLRTRRVWAPPGETRTLELELPDIGSGGTADFRLSDPFGNEVWRHQAEVKAGLNEVAVPPVGREGGFRVSMELTDAMGHRWSGETVLSSVSRVEDDLRYGFFATYPEPAGDYEAKARMLADLWINAVEYYDYFPAHGRYAPTEPVYEFEPFGIEIHAEDVRRKIEAGHARNLLSLAYVAAYAASESVYRLIPDPMTDAQGRVKGFNGQVTTVEEARERGKEIWFWLMNVSEGSDWHRYILAEFRRTLDEDPGDLVSFDGFEVDTYGDPDDTRFFAKGSPRNGDLLSEVLRDFMADIREVTREEKPHGLVSFNSVNEFGVENMVDVTDFLFMEIWRFYTNRLAALVEICDHHRSVRNQRVVLKLYPADMDPARTTWPALTLARVLGACMTGGGTLMVAGEPDETRGEMHGLNSLFYPDHTPMSEDAAGVLRRYYAHDALHYGYTHGRDVFSTPWPVEIPDSLTRVMAAPSRNALALRILHTAGEPRWDAAPDAQPALENQEVRFPLPGGVTPSEVWYSSPDHAGLEHPVAVPFEVTDGWLRFTLPRLQVLGTVVIRYPDSASDS